MNHPDLVNNVYGTGYDTKTSSSPSVVRGEHGTACAGIIGAQQNSIGISGIVPSSKLMSISIELLFSDTPQQLANGFNWAWQNGADVISNSWGGYTPSDIIEDAITAALTQGRDGKGMVVVFAAGNENNTNIRYPGNSNSQILVVGAISPCGERKSNTSCDGEAWGSCYGAALDVVAPGVLIPTTDIQGNAGYNPYIPIHIDRGGTKIANDYSNQAYTVWFNGTSAACPHVAGVAALVLSANPNLTQAEVRAIIESTCTKLPGYSYSLNSNHPNGTWNNQVGHGLVNAYAAVMATLAVTGPDTLCSTGAYTLSAGSASSWSVTPTSAFSLTSTYTASAVVKPLQLSGQAGTLTAIVNA
jgi:subtilisin family serine protease